MTRDELKEKATELGIDFKGNIPTAKLEELVNGASAEDSSESEPLVKETVDIAVEVESEPETTASELVSDYYEGHPRRLIKLRGLLSRTHDNDEYYKISEMIRKLS